MTFNMIILNLLILLVLTYLVNSIFRLNKTVYILLYAVLVFIFISFYLIYLGFEFLALSFFITYIGGIAVMFLFLIIVLNVKLENSREIKKPFFKNYFYILLLNLILVVIFSILFFWVYNYEMFNSREFYQEVSSIFIDQPTLLGTLLDKTELFNFYPLTFRGHSLYKVHDLWDYNFDVTLMHEFNNLQSEYSDIFTLGVFLYKEHYLILIAIAFFLLVAIILSCSISSTKANRLRRW